MLITFVLTLVFVFLLFGLFYYLKRPYYRIDKQQMVHVLQLVVVGEASENDWNMTFGLVIRHSPELESIRQRCITIEEKWYIGHRKPPYLFAPQGLIELKQVLEDLKSLKQE